MLPAIRTQARADSTSITPVIWSRSIRPPTTSEHSASIPAASRTCTLVGGPFALHGETFWGHLNQDSTAFATANYVAGEVDVYKYSPTALTFLYSFTKGLTPSDSVKGAAYNPRSKE